MRYKPDYKPPEQTLNYLTALGSKKLYAILKSLPPETIITTEFMVKNINLTAVSIGIAINLFLSKGWLIKVCRGGYMKAGEFKNINN